MLEHYLSARVPPARLLSGAVRRVWRRARARVAPTPPRPADILAGMQAASAEALALQLASPGRALVAYDRVALTRALARHFPGEAERAIRRAEQALAGRVSIFGRQVDIARAGGGIHWQRDPFARSPLFDRTRDAFVLRIRLAGRACAQDEPAVAQTSGRAVDPRAVWAVGRGDHWVALGCAGVAAPEQAARYAEAFVESLRDFASENPLGVGLQWASPMEAALRLVCVGQAHALLAGQRALEDPRYALELAQLAVGTARLVAARLEDDGAVPNNHLVADHVGLLAAAALLPEWPEAPRWRAAGAAGLRREIMAQTHADGTSFEGSVPYHRLAVELFTAGALLARRARVRLGTPYGRRLAWMYSATRSLLFTGGELPQLGDHDSGRVLAFRERPALSAGYLLPLGAAVTGDPTLRLHAGAEDAEEALWTCGAVAVERLLAGEPGPRPGSATFPDGGFHVLRRGGAEVAISCGRNGQAGVGGHSHNDKLAFELRLGGELVVCDPGSPCYTSDPAARAWSGRHRARTRRSSSTAPNRRPSHTAARSRSPTLRGRRASPSRPPGRASASRASTRGTRASAWSTGARSCSTTTGCSSSTGSSARGSTSSSYGGRSRTSRRDCGRSRQTRPGGSRAAGRTPMRRGSTSSARSRWAPPRRRAR